MIIKDVIKNKYYLKYDPDLTIENVVHFYSKRNGLLKHSISVYLNDEIINHNFKLGTCKEINENSVFTIKYQSPLYRTWI